MGTISSSTGLISGLDIGSIVQQLMQIESKPLTLLKNRIAEKQQEQLAYQSVNALLTASLTSVTRLSQSSSFRVKTATSSNADALSVTADTKAATGSYRFTVAATASTHQVASQGFLDRDATPVGAGTLTLENPRGRIDVDTELSMLNGATGVRRGQIRIIDRSGASSQIDLRAAQTVNDVLDAINNQSDVAVKAYVQGDRIVVEDTTGLGSGAGQLKISNVGTSMTATDLGIAGTEDGSGAITSSSELTRLAASSLISSLNDGMGLRYDNTQADLRFTLASGRVFEINLTDSFTLDTSLGELNDGQGVGAGTIRLTNKAGVTKELQLTGTESLSDINSLLKSDEYKDLKITVSSVSSSGGIVLSDNSGGTGTLKVEDVSGSIAGQLGLEGETTEASETTLSGQANYRLATLQSLIRKIEYAKDTSAQGALNQGDLAVSISADGKHLEFHDNTEGGGTTTVEALNDSKVLEDLGLTSAFAGGVQSATSKRLVAGVNTVLLSSLNGGSGVQGGAAEFHLRSGATASVDFTGAETLQDVVDRINAQDGLAAETSSGGLGLVIRDTMSGTGTFTASGDVLEALHIPTSSTSGVLAGGDLQRRYIAENTKLADLNRGKGVGLTAGSAGSTISFKITNSSGQTQTVKLNGSAHQTVGSVLDAINSAMSSYNVQARINSSGDGIELYETGSTGAGKLKVEELNGGSAAKSLGILGEAESTHPGVLTGSFAATIDISGADTLDDVVTKINAAGVDAKASVINDGSSRPYRLVLTSDQTGSAGRIAFDTGSSGLSFQALSEAHDATVVVGDINSSDSILISSSSNTIKNAVQGLTLNLISTTDSPVQVAVNTDIDSVVSDVSSFVDSYNSILDQIDKLTSYNADTEQGGLLLGDNAVRQVRDRLYRQVSQTLSTDYTVRRLSSVGITGQTNGGGRLTFDEEAFRTAFDADPEGVIQLFTKVATTTDASGADKVEYVGIAASMKVELKALSNSVDGYLTQQYNRLGDQVDLYNNRADQMQALLDKKQEQLYAQFQAMESALADLQTQQSAVTSLSSLVSSYTSA